MVHCEDCGAVLSEPVGLCPHCGGTVGVSVKVAGCEAKASVGNVGTVAKTTAAEGGPEFVVTTPGGAKSESRLAGAQITGQVMPPVDVGRPGEPRVVLYIKARLASQGHKPEVKPATDSAGEDYVIELAGEQVVIQITSFNPRAKFFGEVSKGQGNVDATIAEIATSLHEALAAKAHYDSTSKHSMLLAVDAGHFGSITTTQVNDQYLRQYGEPRDEFGFGGVWVVGPTESDILVLGRSRW